MSIICFENMIFHKNCVAGARSAFVTEQIQQELVSPVLAPGVHVALRNLTLAAELNGALGQIDSFDDCEGRYVVHLPGRSDLKRVRSSNVHAILTGDPPLE